MLNCLKHGLRCRSFRNSLIKSGADTAAVDRNFLFLTFYLRAQKRHEVHRIARFVQGALERDPLGTPPSGPNNPTSPAP